MLLHCHLLLILMTVMLLQINYLLLILRHGIAFRLLNHRSLLLVLRQETNWNGACKLPPMPLQERLIISEPKIVLRQLLMK